MHMLGRLHAIAKCGNLKMSADQHLSQQQGFQYTYRRVLGGPDRALQQ